MSDTPEPPPAPPDPAPVADTSTLLGVSVRGWMAMMITATICYLGIREMEIKDPIYSLGLVAFGAYLGKVVPSK